MKWLFVASVFLFGLSLQSDCLAEAQETCPDQYVQFHFDPERNQPTCVSILTEEDTWLLQRQKCIAQGADLAITTSYLQQQLSVYLSQLPDGQDKNYFMGAIDQGLSEEDWVWIGGEPMVDVVWSNGHPQENDRDCGTLCPQEYLYCSDFCTESYRAICQIGSPFIEATTAKQTSYQTTTAEPSTARPSTIRQTSYRSTTAEPSTVKSSTARQTAAPSPTSQATTARPSTTAKPTTYPTTTPAPSTARPSTTAKQTTSRSTTDKVTTVEPYTTVPPYDVDCPLLYSKWYLDASSQNPVCLKFIADNQVWNTHRALCLDDDARLLERVSPNLQRAIADYLPSIPSYRNESFFVGANDIEIEGVWSWNDGSSIYPGVWAPGQPSGGDVDNCGCLCPKDFFYLCDCRCPDFHYAICVAPGTIVDA